MVNAFRRTSVLCALLIACAMLVPAGAMAPAGLAAGFEGANGEEFVQYLAEGCTAGGMETWLVLQNPTEEPATVDVDFLTAGGRVQGPHGVVVSPLSRCTLLLNSFLADCYDLSTVVTCTSGMVFSERAMYGPRRVWGHCSGSALWSMFLTSDGNPTLFFPEGCTAGGMETWLVLQNPTEEPATVDVDFLTAGGRVQGPHDVVVSPLSRRSLLLNSFLADCYDLSTTVTCTSGAVLCERAMYGPGRAWGHCNYAAFAAVLEAQDEFWEWYFPEGCTAGGVETWLVIQNPLEEPATVDVDFYTAGGRVQGPHDVVVSPLSRRSLLLNSFLAGCYDLSTVVTITSGAVLCERAMYGPGRVWGHCNSSPLPYMMLVGQDEVFTWHFAEGSTAGGMETWLVLQNPLEEPATVDVDFYTAGGRVQGPHDVVVSPLSRRDIRINDYLADCYDLSSVVTCTSGVVFCERSMYGPRRVWGHCDSPIFYYPEPI